MTRIILSCCNSKSKYQIEYQTGEIFNVCENCIKLTHWNRFQKKKIDL